MTSFDDLPAPEKPLLARSHALTDLIRNEITLQGTISFARFMELALYHPQFGYYTNENVTIGKKGDFITAPEISPLFADCFAKQVEQILHHLKGGDLLELGAGTGRFAVDLLLALDKLACLPEKYYIVEISKTLRAKQQALLQHLVPHLSLRVQWLDELPSHFSGVILANEVLDALPVDCFAIDSTGKIQEKRVAAYGENGFIFEAHSPNQTLVEKVSEMRLEPNYQSEINLQLPGFVQSIANCLARGLILFADYGYGRAEYYHPERKQGTLTCFYQHRKHANPLILPGLQDITAHVDFTTVIESAADAGCTLAGYTTQVGFLLGCGLLEAVQLREENANAIENVALHLAVKTLTLPTEMGEVIKVMGLAKDIDIPFIGFTWHDRSRDL